MIAVTGAGGQLGSEVVDVLGGRAIGLTHSALDITDADAVLRVLGEIEPEAIINCAAYTDVDRAESEEELAHQVNTVAVGVMASAASAMGSRFVTISTDYVFDGQKPSPYLESDERSPLNAYGRTKSDGEALALIHETTCVVRTSWVLSATHRNFLTTILDAMSRQEVSVVDDQRGRPTMARDLASSIIDLVDNSVSGIVHLTNSEEMTWYELAGIIAVEAGFPADRVVPIHSSEFQRAARRPMNSTLDSERLQTLGIVGLGSVMPSLAAAVALAGRRPA